MASSSRSTTESQSNHPFVKGNCVLDSIPMSQNTTSQGLFMGEESMQKIAQLLVSYIADVLYLCILSCLLCLKHFSHMS